MKGKKDEEKKKIAEKNDFEKTLEDLRSMAKEIKELTKKQDESDGKRGITENNIE
jgi:hypothetical protein